LWAVKDALKYSICLWTTMRKKPFAIPLAFCDKCYGKTGCKGCESYRVNPVYIKI
jgi:hypothetical protein